MTSIATTRLALVSDRGAAPITGSATVTGATSRGDINAVSLTVHRIDANRATVTGGVSAHNDGRTNLEMTRQGKLVVIRGTVGGQDTGFKTPVVSLTVGQESFTTSTVSGVLLGRTINLVITRDPAQPGVTTVTGKLYPYEQSVIGTVAITIRDVDGLRSYEGGTSKHPEGRVRLHESRIGDDIKTTGKLGGWDVTELSRPASFRALELFDTTLLLVMTQAIRSFARKG